MVVLPWTINGMLRTPKVERLTSRAHHNRVAQQKQPDFCLLQKFPYHDWMKHYQDKCMLDLIVPGSHDAGCIAKYNIDTYQYSAVTQDLDLSDQLCYGIRVYG